MKDNNKSELEEKIKLNKQYKKSEFKKEKN